jgi:hypothetical protein
VALKEKGMLEERERNNLPTYEYLSIPISLPVAMCTNLIRLNNFGENISERCETRQDVGTLISQAE